MSAGTLQAGAGRYLLAPLNAALTELNTGQTSFAIRELHGFISRVRILEIFWGLKPAEGQTLINAAKSLIAELRG